MLIEPRAALDLILQQKSSPQNEVLSLQNAAMHHLAADILAPIDHPIFDQSAVDGYALRFGDLQLGESFQLANETKAGDAADDFLQPGQCARIFTGAPLPQGADTIVMQEWTQAAGANILILDKGLKMGGNVRRKAEQIAEGSLALQKGQVLNPAAIGFLASLGIQSVAVTKAPKVTIVVTGNEFANDATELSAGKIYESNGQMLQAALARLGIVAEFAICKDDLPSLERMVAEKAAQNELLILTGGVSVGDYDFSRPALENNGFEIVFHRVNQKPGKPLLFAKKGENLAFGLPGNPRAVMICFYIYILPLLQQMMGAQPKGLMQVQIPLSHSFKRNGDGKTHFVTAKLSEKGINLLEGQQSHMLQSLAQADVLVELPAEPIEYVEGDWVLARILG